MIPGEEYWIRENGKEKRMGIEENIVKLACGKEQGTAVLVDEWHAITVFHCVRDALGENPAVVTLDIITEKKCRPVNACLVMSEEVEYDEASYVYLELQEPVEHLESVRFMNCMPETFQKLHMFGYGKYRPGGNWIQLENVGRQQAVEGQICDLHMQTDGAEDPSFAGFSGSPLWDEQHSYILGLGKAEDVAGNQPVVLEGISVASQMDFFKSFGIAVESKKTVKRRLEGKTGVLQTVTPYITGVLDAHSDLYDSLLCEVMEKHRRGYRREAQKRLQDYIARQQGDSTVSDEIKAKYLLQQAVWILEDQQNMAGADKVYRRAMEYAPEMDARIFLALREFYAGKTEARELLEPVDSVAVLNTYMQICVNQGDGEAAIEAYGLYGDIAGADEDTWYLLSVANLLRWDFEQADMWIGKATMENADRPEYYLQRALIRYWRTVPQEVRKETAGFYPNLYFQDIYFFMGKMRTAMEEAVAELRIACDRAEGMQREMILSCWLHMLSIDSILSAQMQEPLERLRKENPDHVTLLMVDVFSKRVDENGRFEKRLRALIKKSGNHLGYILVLMEYYIRIRKQDEAKSLLYAYKTVFGKRKKMYYWYVNIAEVEQGTEKRQILAEEAAGDSALTEEEKRRISCALENDHMDKLRKLEELYMATGATRDIHNLIWHAQKVRCWDKAAEYGERLAKEHSNPHGYVYALKSYMQKKQYEEAEACIQSIEALQIPELEEQIRMDKVTVLEKLGEYDRAIETGEVLFQSKQTEISAHMLANLYTKKGSVSDAIRVLQTVEKRDILSPQGYMRLSGLYRRVDPLKALEYGEKYVEAAGHSPEAATWAATNAADIGMSDRMAAYLAEALKNPAGSSALKQVGVEELLEILHSRRDLRQQCEDLFSRGELPIHAVMDALGDGMMSGFFYHNWMDKDRFFMLFFGGAFPDLRNAGMVDQVVLDYTACMFLQELNLLELLGSKLSAIYLPANLHVVILEEQERLCRGQSDLLTKKKKVMDYGIHELHLACVEAVVPEHLEALEWMKRGDAVHVCTAKAQDALWVDTERKGEHTLSVDDLCEALSEEGYPCDYDHSRVDRLPVRKGQRLLTGILALEELYDRGILELVAERYEVLLFEPECRQTEQDWRQWEDGLEVSKRLDALKAALRQLEQAQVLRWCKEPETGEGMYYNLLASGIMTAMELQIPYCVDDRFMSSYVRMDNAPVYSTLDLVGFMYRRGWLDERRYINVYKEFVHHKTGFLAVDAAYVYEGLLSSAVEDGRLVESGQLRAVSEYVDQSFSLLDRFSSTFKLGNPLSERKAYAVLHLIGIRRLLESIWISDMKLEKKRACSNWVILRYSRIGETLSSGEPEALEKDVLVVAPIAQLIMQSLLFTAAMQVIPSYCEWLYGLFWYYLYINEKLLQEVTVYLTHETLQMLRKVEKSNENVQTVFEQSVASGIFHMPDFLRDRILKDDTILAVYDKYFAKMVVLDENFAVPEKLFDEWQQKVLGSEAGKILDFRYEQIECRIAWEEAMPLWPILKIGRQEKVYGLFCEPGVRLYHENAAVRIRAARNVYAFLGNSVDLDVLEQMGGVNYIEAADRLRAELLRSASFVEEQLRYVVKEKHLYHMKAGAYFLPDSAEYFRKFYDHERSFICEDWDILSLIPIRFDGTKPCGRSMHPVRRLHHLAGLVHENKVDNPDEYCCMFAFLRGGNDYRYGQMYIALLRIVFAAMEEHKEYASHSLPNRILWTYIWAGRLFEEIEAQIRKGEIDLEEYQEALCACSEELGKQQRYSPDLKDFDVLHPFQMHSMRLCLLGTVEICMSLCDAVSVHKCILDQIADGLKTWLSSSDAVLEYRISHIPAGNAWNTPFAADYRRELEKLRGLAYGQTWEEPVPDRMELQKLLEKDDLSTEDEFLLIIACLNDPDEETTALLKEVLERFYLDKRISYIEKYTVVEMILSRLSKDTAWNLRKEKAERLKDALIEDAGGWKQTVSELIYVAGEEPSILVEFWEMVADEMGELPDTECIEWLTRLQLLLPADLGRRLYLIKSRFLGGK